MSVWNYKQIISIDGYWLRVIKRKFYYSKWLRAQSSKKKKKFICKFIRPFLETLVYFSSLNYTLPDITMSQ